MTARTLEMDAFEGALRQYAIAHDIFAEREQIHVLKGEHIEAAGCHECCLRLLRAYVAEKDDPEPVQ